MKKTTLFVLAMTTFTAFSQNYWDGSTISTTTTNGNLGLGASSSSSRIYINSTSGSISNNISATLNNNVVGTQYGISNTSTFLGSGTKYGIYNSLSNSSSTGAMYGMYNNINSSSSNTVMGEYIYMAGTGSGQRYGVNVNMAGSGTGNKYGVYVNVANGGTGDTRYGIYSSASGTGAKAAYFVGDVETKGNYHLTNNNESRFIFATNWEIGTPLADQYMLITPNTTSGQYDWNFNKSIRFFNNGLLEKRIGNADKTFAIHRADLAQDVFRVYGDGRVFATELNVRLASNFPDYVFTKEYRLAPLSEVKEYIQTNGHLSNMPAAATVEKEGMNVGDVTKTLVEKVEELTLYILQQQEEIETLKKLIIEQKKD